MDPYFLSGESVIIHHYIFREGMARVRTTATSALTIEQGIRNRSSKIPRIREAAVALTREAVAISGAIQVLEELLAETKPGEKSEAPSPEPQHVSS